VHDVEDLPRQALDGRPLEAVPGPIEQANRDPPVDIRDRADVARRQPVFPRAGEERDRVGAFAACGRAGRKRPRQFVHVFAHAGPFPEGGTVVEEDAHGLEDPNTGCKPLSLNRLTGFLGAC